MDMYRFVTTMQRHTATEVKFGRPFRELELATNVIQHALDDQRYEMTAQTAKASVQQSLAQGATVAYTMQNTAQALEPSKTTTNNSRSATDGDIPTMNKFDARRTQSLHPKKQVQCRSCQSWGHDGQCHMMCKIVNITKWIKENPEEAEKQATAYSQSNSKKMVNLLHVEDEGSLHMGIEDMMTALYVEEENEPVMKKMQAPADWEDIAKEYQSMDGALHPFTTAIECIDSRIMKPPEELPPAKTDTSITMKTMKINLQQDNIRLIRFTHQADGGANFAATEQLDLLHNYKPHIKSIPIVAFFSQEEDGEAQQPQESHTAIGEGILKLIGDYGEMIPMRLMQTPNLTGTVVSPERTMKDMQ
jgi:hypothetical protein